MKQFTSMVPEELVQLSVSLKLTEDICAHSPAFFLVYACICYLFHEGTIHGWKRSTIQLPMMNIYHIKDWINGMFSPDLSLLISRELTYECYCWVPVLNTHLLETLLLQIPKLMLKWIDFQTGFPDNIVMSNEHYHYIVG